MSQLKIPPSPPDSSPTPHPLRGLLSTQFLGAFNDNAWKYMIITLALRPIMAASESQPEAINQQSQWQATVALLVFTIPMILFSLPAAALADRFSKRSIMISMKLVETALMAAAALALLFLPLGLTGPLIILGLMGVQSALFSPAKYGILPEILPHEKLSSGNGLLEMWTMAAIIAGTGLGPVFLGLFDHGGAVPGRTWVAAGILVILAGLGAWTALQIPRVPAAGGSGRMVSTLAGAIHAIRADRALLLAIGGAVFYWTVLSLLGQNVYVYTRAITADLAEPELISGIPLALFGVGVGLGAVLAGRLSGDKIETGLIPLGSLVFAFFTLLLGAIQPGIVGTNILVTCVGIGGGLVIVPLHALIQWLSPAERRGAIIAVTNIFTLTGVVAGSLAAFGLASTSSDFGVLLLVCAACVIVGTAWAVWMLPDALIRLGLFLLTHTFYRVNVVGRAHVPETGPALLVPNHMALIDGLLIHACLDRPVHFLVHS
ncbi:MAG: MFS transporter, partial [Phycisphaerae bacterium]|nr:MFS transporter [Phycisphaerae bacterium]